MPLVYYKLIAAILIFLVTVIAVFYPFKIRKHPHLHHLLDLGDAFASGVFLGAALFHMLPNASNQLRLLFPAMHYPLGSLLCVSGFLLLLFLERLSESKSNNYLTIPYVLGVIIIIHSLIEGAVLGINTELSALSIIFIAVLAHKGSESFALSVTLNRAPMAFTPILILIGIFTLMTPLGIVAGTTLNSFLSIKEGQLATAGFNAFAAGTFLYMSTLHHIHHHQRLHETENLMEFLCLFAGAAVMALVALWG